MYDGIMKPMNSRTATGTTFTVEKRDTRKYNLTITGSFKPGWLARLSTGLSEYQINILSGKGDRGRGLYWTAEFELETSLSSRDPENLDYQALIDSDLPASNIDNLELTDYRIDACDDGGKAVWVEVQGLDKLGFLQNVLKCFALYSLFPNRLDVVTIGNRIHDRFLVTGIAGSAPTATALQGLEESFKKFLTTT